MLFLYHCVSILKCLSIIVLRFPIESSIVINMSSQHWRGKKLLPYLIFCTTFSKNGGLYRLSFGCQSSLVLSASWSNCLVHLSVHVPIFTAASSRQTSLLLPLPFQMCVWNGEGILFLSGDHFHYFRRSSFEGPALLSSQGFLQHPLAQS